jgi:thiamine pyrophosphokinase
VLIFGALCGTRFDQEMANIHCLYTWNDCFNRIVLIDVDKTTCLLQANVKHVIQSIREQETQGNERIYEGRYIGLIPLATPARAVTTTGLQWNLNGEALEFGKRISSSNSIPGTAGDEEVTVESSDPLIWTATWTTKKDL